MALFSGNRHTVARAFALGSLALATSTALVACGSDDSTASSDPTSAATASTSAGAATSSAGGSTASTSTAVTSPGAAATAPPEQPQSIEGFPGPTVVEVSPQAQQFLDGLKARGIDPAGDGSVAVNTANYICAAGAQTDDEVRTFVIAFVGQEAEVAGRAITPEQAQKDAQTYIDVAHDSYCK
ncbi:hypothetical protein ABH922_004886 [Rhodococcus sp. 27YEA15]|uniref:DUF732 domain-containing protein n=1 Tax=Rhodococcus sp. 27YEA15 TaxID=3156259 RepID=UPI003C7E0C31